MTSPEKTPISRRGFLEGLGAAVLMIGFEGCHKQNHGPGSPRRPPAPRGPNAAFEPFLVLGADNVMTAIIAQTEGGQGNSTGITQVIASELGASWDLVRFQFTTERLSVYVNPTLYRDLVITAGSSSIPAFYKQHRHAAATLREMLVAAAAARWRVHPSECSARDSHVFHTATERSFTFADLAPDALKQSPPQFPTVRGLKEQPLIGKRMARLDIPAKIRGQATYGIDGTFPGMVYAAVRHGRARGANVKTFTPGAAEDMPGVHFVTTIPEGVAVVADHYWQAVKALEEVVEEYDANPNDGATSATVGEQLRQALTREGFRAKQSHGHVEGAFLEAATTVSGEFSLPLLSHVCMEPVSATAWVDGNRCSLWLSTKSPTLDAQFAAEALGVDAESVTIYNQFQGGDFGRRAGREHVTEAVLLAKKAGVPVKVIWTRQEDIRLDRHRTSFLARARMGLDKEGHPIAYQIKSAATGVWQDQFPWWYEEQKPLDLPLLELVGSTYGIANEDGHFVPMMHPVRTGALRGNNDYYNRFVLETLLNEASAAIGQDPLQYRKKLMAKDQRSVAVLDRVADLANWGHAAAGRFQGIAFMHSEKNWKCRMAVVVEISLLGRDLKIESITCVCDSGLVINPTLAEQCLEGGLIFGLSNALYEEITLEGGAPQQTNFDGYRVLRLNETPAISVETIASGDEPASFGEIACVPVGAALGNAIQRATGRRIHKQPFAKQDLTFV